MIKDKYFKLKIDTCSSNFISPNFSGAIDTMRFTSASTKTEPLSIRLNDVTDSTGVPLRIIDHTGNVCGQINVRCLSSRTANLRVVYVKTDTIYPQFNENTLRSRLNDVSYNQAFVHWDFDSDTLDIDSSYQAGLKSYLSNTSNSINNRKRMFCDSLYIYYINKIRPIVPNVYYLFITNIPALPLANGNHVAGFSPRGMNYEFMAVPPTGSTNDYYTDCIHEIGHSLDLGHIWTAPFSISQGTTKNYMDYVNAGATDNRYNFWNKQWRIILLNIRL